MVYHSLIKFQDTQGYIIFKKNREGGRGNKNRTLGKLMGKKIISMNFKDFKRIVAKKNAI